MRIPRRAIPIQPLTHLWERHKEIARLLLSGMTQQEIARKLDFSESWLSIVCNSPIFRKYLDSLRSRVETGLADVRETINQGAVLSANVLLGMLKQTDVSPATKAKVAFDFLDRAGYGAIKTVRNENLNVHLTGDRLQQLKEERDRLLNQSRIDTTSIVEISL